jgi:hypothetical protein
MKLGGIVETTIWPEGPLGGFKYGTLPLFLLSAEACFRDSYSKIDRTASASFLSD